MKLQQFSVTKLLKTYGDIIRELRNRGVVRSSNNPTADYAEYIVCKKLKLKIAPSNTKSYDALDRLGKKYQIKSRRLTIENKTQLFGVIRDVKKANFDFVLGVIFDEDFTLKEVWKIPRSAIIRHAKYSHHQRGHIINMLGSIRRDKSVKKVV